MYLRRNSDKYRLIYAYEEKILSVSSGRGVGDLSRILGLDYGSKTVGVAVSDELLFTAQGLEIAEDSPLINCASLWQKLRNYQRI